MAERNEQVMQVVVDELRRNPEIGSDELYARAREIDPSIDELSRRQFHGRNPLQAKRMAASGRPRKRGAAKRRGSGQSARGKQAKEAAAPTPQRRGRRSAGRGAAAASDGAGSARDAIRGVFLEFASAFAQAESRPDIVRVMSGVDGYGERVEKLIAKAAS